MAAFPWSSPEEGTATVNTERHLVLRPRGQPERYVRIVILYTISYRRGDMFVPQASPKWVNPNSWGP
jgi:hypothetical protein